MIDDSDITIRPATDQDSEAILDLLFGIWVDEHHFDVKRENFPDLHAVEKYYINAQGMFFVAVHQGIVIGTIACQKLSEDAFALKRMFVAKKHRGSGLAQKLLDKLFAHMASLYQDIPVHFYLSTKEDTAIAAKKFYLRNGFKIIAPSDVPPQFPFFYEDDLYMMAKL